MIPKILKNTFIDLFLFYFKGAKVDAALSFLKRSRNPRGDYIRPGAKHLPEGKNYFDSKDKITVWEIKTFFNLILKNNSKYFAYNLQILNPEIFTFCTELKPLTSLAPNESISLDVNFIQIHDSHSGVETDVLPSIPSNVLNEVLEIQYANEAGTKLKTKFYIDSKKITNVHYFV